MNNSDLSLNTVLMSAKVVSSFRQHAHVLEIIVHTLLMCKYMKYAYMYV